MMSHSYVCWQSPCVFSLWAGVDGVNASGSTRLFPSQRSDSRREDAVPSGWGVLGGWDTLFDCYAVAKGSMAFELERCGGMNTCATRSPAPSPLPRKSLGYLSPCLRLRHSASGREEKSRKVSRGRLLDCQSGVRGQRSQLSGYVRC